MTLLDKQCPIVWKMMTLLYQGVPKPSVVPTYSIGTVAPDFAAI